MQQTEYLPEQIPIGPYAPSVVSLLEKLGVLHDGHIDIRLFDTAELPEVIVSFKDFMLLTILCENLVLYNPQNIRFMNSDILTSIMIPVAINEHYFSIIPEWVFSWSESPVVDMVKKEIAQLSYDTLVEYLRNKSFPTYFLLQHEIGLRIRICTELSVNDFNTVLENYGLVEMLVDYWTECPHKDLIKIPDEVYVALIYDCYSYFVSDTYNEIFSRLPTERKISLLLHTFNGNQKVIHNPKTCTNILHRHGLQLDRDVCKTFELIISGGFVPKSKNARYS